MAISSAIPTKLGQPSTSSPRTLHNNRRRLDTFFTFSSTNSPSRLVASNASSNLDSSVSDSKRTAKSTNREAQHASQDGGIWGWMTSKLDAVSLDGEPLKQEKGGAGFVGMGAGSDGNTDGPRTTYPAREQRCYLQDLPDELIIKIFSYLPPTSQSLLDLSLVSTHCRYLANSPVLWLNIFNSTPGFRLTSEASARGVAVDIPPMGRWDGDHWVWESYDPSSKRPLGASDLSLRIHYPTLYRSRLALHRQLRCPTPITTPHTTVLTKHSDSVYCHHSVGPWLITGSRDRSIRIWRLGEIDEHGEVRPTELVVTVEDAHERSILSVRFEVGNKGKDLLVTGSSDATAGIWEIDWGMDPGGMAVKRVGTLRGHERGVLDVRLGKDKIVTCSKDTTIRVYDRSTLSHSRTITCHAGPVNGLSLHPDQDVPQVVSVSGDGKWVISDIETGLEVRRGGGDGRGLACVAWEAGNIVTGDNDHLIKLFSSTSASLLKTFEGHTQLARAVALDPDHRIVISGSYDHTIRMWDMDSGKCIRVIKGHDSLVFGVEMAAGRLISTSADRTVRVTTFGAGLPYRGTFA